jgi:hypothetical protein
MKDGRADGVRATTFLNQRNIRKERTMHWIDPDHLPKTVGVVKQFIPNPRGDLDGLVLIGDAGDAVLVHFPPHLSEQVKASIKIGDEIRIHGVRPRGVSLVAAVSLVPAIGEPIVDNGRPDKDKRETEEIGKLTEPSAKDITGRVSLSLYTPRGELRGALLEDGSVLRIGPKEAAHFDAFLHTGAKVAARGEGLDTAYGLVIDVREIGPAPNELRAVKSRRPEQRKKKHHEKKEKGAGEPKTQHEAAVRLGANS